MAVVEEGRCGYLYAAVFDGHAGDAAARYLAETLYPALAAALDEDDVRSGSGGSAAGECDAAAPPPTPGGLCCPADLAPALAAAFERVDARLVAHLAKARDAGDRKAGSTATVLLARPGRLVAANVGDSRAVLCRAGRALDLTTEHRVEGRGPTAAAERARVEAAGGWTDDGRVLGILAVSRAFGDAGLKGKGLAATLKEGVASGEWTQEFAASRSRFASDPVVPTPDVTQIDTGPGDEFAIVASDGLWDVVPSADAVRVARAALRRGGGPAAAAAALVAAAGARRTQDNVAVVVVDLGGGERGGAGGKGGGGSLFGGLFGRG